MAVALLLAGLAGQERLFQSQVYHLKASHGSIESIFLKRPINVRVYISPEIKKHSGMPGLLLGIAGQRVKSDYGDTQPGVRVRLPVRWSLSVFRSRALSFLYPSDKLSGLHIQRMVDLIGQLIGKENISNSEKRATMFVSGNRFCVRAGAQRLGVQLGKSPDVQRRGATNIFQLHGNFGSYAGTRELKGARQLDFNLNPSAITSDQCLLSNLSRPFGGVSSFLRDSDRFLHFGGLVVSTTCEACCFLPQKIGGNTEEQREKANSEVRRIRLAEEVEPPGLGLFRRLVYWLCAAVCVYFAYRPSDGRLDRAFMLFCAGVLGLIAIYDQLVGNWLAYLLWGANVR